MTALNVALPLSGLLSELYHCSLISPVTATYEDLDLMVTPYGSSESGIGSSDSDENKNQKSSSEDDEAPATPTSPISLTSPISSASPISQASPVSPTSPISPTIEVKSTSPILEKSAWDEKIEYQGRDILDLAKNLTYKNTSWKFQYARLPDNNVAMFMANRSQYHRLGANGLNREYDLAVCRTCTFQFPVNSPNIIYNNDGATNVLHEKPKNNLPSFKMYKHF